MVRSSDKSIPHDTGRINATFSTRAIISFSPFTVINGTAKMRPKLDNSCVCSQAFFFFLLLLLFFFFHNYGAVARNMTKTRGNIRWINSTRVEHWSTLIMRRIGIAN